MTKELSAFKKHFTSNCDVKVIHTIEERTYPHWKRLCFGHLTCVQMTEISWYIQSTFSNEGCFSHLLPKLGVYDGYLCLTVDVKQIKEKIMGEI